MPVDATWRIQSNSAQVTSATGFTASLPNPTAGGTTLLLFAATAGAGVLSLAANTSFDPPWFQDQAHSSQWYAWRRDDQPAGETSWAMTGSGAAAPWYWRVEEWAGLSFIDQPDSNQNVVTLASVLTLDTDSTGLVGSPVSADVSDFAALAVFRVATTSNVAGFPAAHSYGAGQSAGPSSWNEVAWLVNGAGSGSNDFILGIVEAYPGATGNVAAGLTLDTSGGGATPQAIDAWCVLYQPAAAAPPTGVLTS